MEIHSDGRVHTKTEEIAEIKAGTPPARPDGPDTDIKVRMYGSTAVYTAQRNPSDGAVRGECAGCLGCRGARPARHRH